MIDARAVVVSDPFMAAMPVLDQLGLPVLTAEQLLDASPADPVHHRRRHGVPAVDVWIHRTPRPFASPANVVANAEAMFVGAAVDIDTDVIVSWLPCFHDMGMTGYLTVPMYFGVELVKVTPMDFLQDALLWPKLIDTYRGTMMAAPNFAYNLLAKRLRRQATPGQFDLSSLRWSTLGRGAGGPRRRGGSL
jgi:fatty-acyl-CoA synthase